MMDEMAELCADGLTVEIGVSNYGVADLLRAHAALARHGIRLASNQVHFSLLNRKAERAGMLEKCRELGIRVIAHTPLEQGLLTGKYGPDHPPPMLRRAQHSGILSSLPGLLRTMTLIGHEHGQKSCAQVALNWLICKGAIPIPGAKTGAQASENFGSLGWQLSPDEVASLEGASDELLG
jgi:aryl-alcohol dehydrogenase-like predicted oxidoreductase